MLSAKIEKICHYIRKPIYIALIVFMLTMLLSALTLMWGRIFARHLTACPLTAIWSCIRSMPRVQSLMQYIRGSSFYACLAEVTRDNNGEMTNLCKWIESMGIVSVFFSVINEQLSLRRYGMLMKDVVKYNFPFRLFFQVVLHPAFAVSGIVACHKNIGIAAMMCFCGILICFLYSLNLLRCIVLSEKARRKRVLKYINHKKGFDNGDNKDIQSHIHDITLSYAEYLGAKWSHIAPSQSHYDEIKEEDARLIDLFTHSIFPPESSTSKNFSHNAKLDASLAKSCLLSYFPEAKNHPTREAPYILLVERMYLLESQGSSDYDSQPVFVLRKHVTKGREIWDVLFKQLADHRQRVEMASTILGTAYENQPLVFEVLSMGLLLHLGFAQCSITRENTAERAVQSVDFLMEIQSIYASTHISSDIIHFAWKEIILTACNIVQWLLILNQPITDISTKILSRLESNSSKVDMLRLNNNAHVYTTLALLLFAYENLDIHNSIPSYSLMQLYPAVSHALLK